MNKPAYAAIQTYAPTKPTLVFVSSRRQTRLTALDLIGYAAADERPQQFVHMPEEELEATVSTLKVASLGHPQKPLYLPQITLPLQNFPTPAAAALQQTAPEFD